MVDRAWGRIDYPQAVLTAFFWTGTVLSIRTPETGVLSCQNMPTYLSAEGFKKLEAELDYRKRELRREIAARIEAAKELGDLSENFEYHEAKDQQGTNEMRIDDLEGMIRDTVIVAQQTGQTHVTMGSTFTVESKLGKRTFEIVGSNEADPLSGKISNESPLGLAFLGQKVGDVVEIAIPSGT